MKRILFSIAGSLFVLFQAHGALVAYWNFNTYNGSDGTIAPDQGAGSLTINGFTGAENGRGNFAGSTINARGSDPAGSSLSLLNDLYNGNSFTLSVSGTSLSDFVLSYATQRSGTGFTTHTWEYSTDGVNFTSFAPVSIPNAYELRTIDFSSVAALDNQPQVYFRDILTGATGSTGNNRFDNLQITAVPEPRTYGVICGLGLLGFCILRTYRRHHAKSRTA